MSKVVYVDTSRTATNGKKRRKPHYVFDGEKVFEVDKLTKLKDVTEVFIDTLFPEIYEEVLEMLRRDIKVYLLKNLSILKKLQRENNLRKSDYNDAVVLSKIPREYFRELTVEEMELKVKMRPLINRYEWVVKKRMLKQWKSKGFTYNFEETIKMMDSDRKKVSREIIREMIDNHVYKEACRMLRINNSVELAILAVELPLHLPLTDLKGLLGYTPNKNRGRYNHRLRVVLQASQ